VPTPCLVPQAEDGDIVVGHHRFSNTTGPEVLVTGWAEGGPMADIYGNWYGSLQRGISLPGLSASACDWADFDNDGHMDILMTGFGVDGPSSSIHSYLDLNSYDELSPGLRGVYDGAASWVDFDGDGALDILISGWGQQSAVTNLYRNAFAPPNTPPQAPLSPASYFVDGVLELRWMAGSDAETPVEGLTYNLRVGSTPGGSDILSAMADPATGHRYVRGFGNVINSAVADTTSWRIARFDLLGLDEVYWSVQTVDEAFAGSPFIAEQIAPLSGLSAVGPEPELPRSFALQGNYPNPFNPLTTVAFDLPQTERVDVVIYDVAGRQVRKLVGEPLPAGRHRVKWNGTDDRGQPVGAGVYLYRMTAGVFSDSRRMVLVR